jgi:hypothetical protein
MSRSAWKRRGLGRHLIWIKNLFNSGLPQRTSIAVNESLIRERLGPYPSILSTELPFAGLQNGLSHRLELHHDRLDGCAVNPPHTHLLPVVDEQPDFCARDVLIGRFSGSYPDVVASLGKATVLARGRSDPAFEELLPQIVTRGRFRHRIFTLGFADHIRRHTEPPVRIQSSDSTGRRNFDLVLGKPPCP